MRRVTGSGPVALQALDQFRRMGERGQVAAVHLVRFEAQPLLDHAPHERSREEAVVPAEQEPRRDVGPRGERPRLLERRAGLRPHVVPRSRRATSAGTSCRNVATSSKSSPIGRPSRSACSRMAWAWPVLAHHSPGDSPGRGTIAATRIIRSTGTRSHTSGAVKPAIDCATRIRSVRSPIASTTASVYSAKPAESSSAGQVHRHHVVTQCFEFRYDQVPVPRVRSGAVNEYIGGHGSSSCRPTPHPLRSGW